MEKAALEELNRKELIDLAAAEREVPPNPLCVLSETYLLHASLVHPQKYLIVLQV